MVMGGAARRASPDWCSGAAARGLALLTTAHGLYIPLLFLCPGCSLALGMAKINGKLRVNVRDLRRSDWLRPADALGRAFSHAPCARALLACCPAMAP